MAESQQVDLYGQNTPLPIFIMPIVFGGITMLIVIKGIVNQLLDQFKANYRMLAILGATVNALAAILGIQIGIVSGVSALLGGVIALPLTRFCYVWLQADCWAPNVAEYVDSFFVQGTFVNGYPG
ncbi:hypothetical protein QY885_11225 [Latilactobacillus sakei]